jgi:hypothetical protein
VRLAEEPRLLSELGSSRPMSAYDRQGRLIRCMGQGESEPEDELEKLVYLSPEGMPWQWVPEAVGHTQQISVRSYEEAFVDGPPGTREAAWEAAARLQHDGDSSTSSTSSIMRNITLETLSAWPPIFRVRELVPDSVLDSLLRHASPMLELSTVGDPTHTSSGREPHRRHDDRRTSRSAWLHGHNDPRKTLPAARSVQRVAASLLRLEPYAHRLLRSVEPLLAVSYGEGAFYEPHHDFFGGKDQGSGQGDATESEPRQTPKSTAADAIQEAFKPPTGSNRFATLILYLASPDGGESGGGHTVFPLAAPSNVSRFFDGARFVGGKGEAGGSGDDGDADADTDGGGDSNRAPSCDFPQLHQRRGLLVSPRRGDAILFYSQRPDGSLDDASRHGGCPVLRGTKAAANVWVWNRNAIYVR